MSLAEAPPPLTKVMLECNHCREPRMLRTEACRLRLFTHGLVVLNWFCPNCYELARQECSIDFAVHLDRGGVPSDIVRVPMEMGEHPPASWARISEAEVMFFERMPLTRFNVRFHTELTLGR